MTRLLITRGLPASGKTTFARKLQPRVVRVNREWARLAARFRATLEVHDLTEVPLAECLRRDAARPAGERVGERTIRRMHDRYLAGRNLPLPVPYVDPDDLGVIYDPDPELPAAVLVDIDGTVALIGDRSQVVRMWRDLGLTHHNQKCDKRAVFQVAEGDF
jgi:hypothetical protein